MFGAVETCNVACCEEEGFMDDDDTCVFTAVVKYDVDCCEEEGCMGDVTGGFVFFVTYDVGCCEEEASMDDDTDGFQRLKHVILVVVQKKDVWRS